jgi:hypothetical protein
MWVPLPYLYHMVRADPTSTLPCLGSTSTVPLPRLALPLPYHYPQARPRLPYHYLSFGTTTQFTSLTTTPLLQQYLANNTSQTR